MIVDPVKIRARIAEILPPDKVVPRHNAYGHFYEVNEGLHPVYPSVTGRLQILKDEGLSDYKMNRAIESLRTFFYSNLKWLNSLSDGLLMAEIDKATDVASRVTKDILNDAGDVGTRIHNIRETIFNKWIQSGHRPSDFLKFIPPEEVDVRVVSAVRALQKFCEERDYIPVACELLVYSHELKVAGTLDDLGLCRQILSKGDPDCEHEIVDDIRGKRTCLKCGYQLSAYELVLMDLKTSNQFKDHYFFQVALYWWMLTKLLGKAYSPKRCFILKVSKEDGSYKIEDLKRHAKLASYARYMLKTNEGVEFIKSLRKDNQKVVAPIMQL